MSTNRFRSRASIWGARAATAVPASPSSPGTTPRNRRWPTRVRRRRPWRHRPRPTSRTCRRRPWPGRSARPLGHRGRSLTEWSRDLGYSRRGITRVVRFGNRQYRLGHVGDLFQSVLQVAEGARDRGLDGVADEVHAGDHEKPFGSDEFGSQKSHGRYFGKACESVDERVADGRWAGLAGEEYAVAVDEEHGHPAEQDPDQNRTHGVPHRLPSELVHQDPEKRDGDADQRGTVLREHGAHRRIRRPERILEHVALGIGCLPAQLPQGLKQRRALQYEGDRKDEVGEPVVLGSFGAVQELGDSPPDRYRGSDDEQADRGQQ